MKKMFYTGVGSRETPKSVQALMSELASLLEKSGYTLRSGGALGADEAFESGVVNLKDIYIPWRKFTNNPLHKCPEEDSKDLAKQASSIAIEIMGNPHWNRCSYGGQKLHTRNVYQVLGEDLNTPSEFLLCWTSEGKTKGGTATAIRLAKSRNIPVINFGTKRGLDFANFLVKILSGLSSSNKIELVIDDENYSVEYISFIDEDGTQGYTGDMRSLTPEEVEEIMELMTSDKRKPISLSVSDDSDYEFKYFNLEKGDIEDEKINRLLIMNEISSKLTNPDSKLYFDRYLAYGIDIF